MKLGALYPCISHFSHGWGGALTLTSPCVTTPWKLKNRPVSHERWKVSGETWEAPVLTWGVHPIDCENRGIANTFRAVSVSWAGQCCAVQPHRNKCGSRPGRSIWQKLNSVNKKFVQQFSTPFPPGPGPNWPLETNYLWSKEYWCSVTWNILQNLKKKKQFAQISISIKIYKGQSILTALLFWHIII